mgnify:CR=1 FL=1|jgi:hypothetical protein
MATNSVGLFTVEEHAIIADWLSVKPRCEIPDMPDSMDALDELGYQGKASGYGEEDAAVADMVLERINNTLPQWAAVKIRESDDEEAVIIRGREVRERSARRKIELVPKYLMTINWADSGPGFSWPVAYHATWVPIYNEYVVTQSADCPDAYGYCDFAIGHFSETNNFVAEAAREIKEDWEWQRDQFCQSSWAYLFRSGLIDKATSLRLREEVWSDEPA